MFINVNADLTWITSALLWNTVYIKLEKRISNLLNCCLFDVRVVAKDINSNINTVDNEKLGHMAQLVQR